MKHFLKGDSLRIINNLDEDGELCEGALGETFETIVSE